MRPQVATGVKRSLPDNIVFTYQGDGDLASIGLCETVSARGARRNITVIFVNNAIYGMTGGQMAPTLCPARSHRRRPMDATLTPAAGRSGSARCSRRWRPGVSRARDREQCEKRKKKRKKAIEKAFRYQVEGKGFSLIEVLSACPTNWGLTPQKALEWIDEKMIPYYPLGVYRDKEG